MKHPFRKCSCSLRQGDAPRRFSERSHILPYYRIEKALKLKRSMWHRNPEAFTEALKQIFGAQGGRLLLNAIARTHGTIKPENSGKTVSLPALIRLAERHTRGGGNRRKKPKKT
jgi:hypothetical protein